MLTKRASDKQSSIKSQLDTIESDAGKMISSSAAELKTLREEVTRLLSSAKKNPDQSSTDPLAGLGEQLAKLQIAAGTTERETRILQQLYFKEIFYREDTIENASEGTFEWILAPETEPSKISPSSSDGKTVKDDDVGSIDHGDDDRLESSDDTDGSWFLDGTKTAAKSLLQSWLTNGSGVFYISGKPGAGKSTLMKLLFNHSQTKAFLQDWAGGKKLVLVPFFFWNSGSELQKNLQGLYRSLLLHVLSQCPTLIPELFPDQWKRVSSTSVANSSLDSEMFRAPMIKEAFDRLMEMPLSSDRLAFCFFIDGLDEYEAHAYDHKRLAMQLCGWAKHDNIKVCVSSRPHVEFTDTFPSELRIDLHKLTASDIWSLACKMFESDPNFDRVRDIYTNLVEEVVQRAEGVFLWARLVLKTLLREVGLHSTYDRLLQKICSLPREMDALYDGILADLDDSDRRRADLVLNLVCMHSRLYHINAICFTWLDDLAQPTFPSAEHLSRINSRDGFDNGLEAIERQLSGLTKGLLVLSRNASFASHGFEFFSYHVNFFHRTARDYLVTAPRRKRLKKTFPNLDFSDVLCRLKIAELALSRSAWSGVINLDLVPFQDLAWSVLNNDGNFRQLALETTQVMHDNFDRLHRANFITLLSNEYYMTRSVAGHEVSFLHYAAALHQILYVREVMAISQGRGIPPHSGDECADAQEMSLLLSATSYRHNPEYVAMLLGAGVSTQCRLHLFREQLEGDKLVRADKTMNLWMVFLARLGSAEGLLWTR